MADSARVEELSAQVEALKVEVAAKEDAIKSLEGAEQIPTSAPAMPPAPPAEAAELLVYDGDNAIGADVPSLASLEFVQGSVEGGKPLVVTFHSNLNKSDFATLTYLNTLAEQYKGTVEFLSISRDHEKTDAEKWIKKFNHQHFAELSGRGGAAGCDVKCDFAMAYDPSHQVNAAFKTNMKKAVVGVGLVILADKDGKIQWYETFVRGDNPAGQFEYQLAAVANGTQLLSNGPAPEIEEEEEEVGGEAVPDDIDDMLGGSGNY